MIKRGVTLEPAVEIVSEAVVPVEFIDQLEDDAGAETVDLFNVTLATKPPLRLRVTGVLD